MYRGLKTASCPTSRATAISPKAKKIRGTKKQVAKAQAAFTAVANDAARKQADAVQADTDDLAAIEALAKDLSRDRGKA